MYRNIRKFGKLLLMDGKPRIYLLMRTVVGDMREPDVFRADSRGALKSLQERKMRWVRGFAESVDDKMLRALNEFYAFVGNGAAVGHVRE